MLRGVFVTGTDTGVGKTVAAAAILLRYRGRIGAARLRYWKPIQTGIEQDDDTATVQRLARCGAGDVLDAGVRLERPVSPHLAARLSGNPIDVEALVALAAQQPASDRFVVEGAGGVLVPIDHTLLMVDLMARLGLPVVIVARTALGTINHTLLTLEAVRRRGLRVVGVILSGVPDEENGAAVERYGSVPVIGTIPPIVPLTADVFAGWASDAFDRGACLEAALR